MRSVVAVAVEGVAVAPPVNFLRLTTAALTKQGHYTSDLCLFQGSPSCHESFCANYISHHPQTLKTLCSIPHSRLLDSTLSNSAYLLHPFFIIEAANIAQHAFHTTFKDLLVNGKYSDLFIACHDDTYNVQKAIVPGKEHEEGKVDLAEYDPRAVKALVQYLYEVENNTNLQDNEKVEASTPAPNKKNNNFHYEIPHTCMYKIGEKYQVISLKDLAAEKFSRSRRKYWNDKEFPEAVHNAFTTTMEYDVGLRQPATKTISKHMKLLNKPEMTKLIPSLLELWAKDVG
ncbi:hypothetical protein SNOG_14847 [Parastagonospora nodorum SN15]|uniref:BTB domain-containing protein n=2 Tax=Phaeosphaeria nodorum (strain SN15 / ATCC MYA-4574 / FGSC 10173) TaxID=321614 RepID=A0A7U2F173_PHANO|nr:hypothetical protein SNOG_14847 [Parastagonospora nodorum SN15]EAT77699.2 hypothetical protein SNOG_14847 [Parastagonospora nodorum SN15]QRC94684.1 hypothetical protein JI435_148470 [Parastagonospora nodorum SN15]